MVKEMMMDETFGNVEYGIESRMYSVADKYHVKLRDTDADETLETVNIFTTIEAARNYAKALVK